MKHTKHIFKSVDLILLFIPILLGIISITLISSASYTNGSFYVRDAVIQFPAYCLGFLMLIILLLVEYKNYYNNSKFLYFVSILLLLLPFSPLGLQQNGSYAWIDLGITTVQPSELVKIFFVLCYACFLSGQEKLTATLKDLCLAVLYALPIIVLIAIEDTGNAIVLITMTLAMIFMSGIDLPLFLKCGTVGVLSLPIAFVFLKDYQKQRIFAFLYPQDLSLSGNYQVWNSKVAIGSGGFWGKGLFNGTQKELKYLPVQKSDFVFSVLVEELGFLGGIALLALYGLFFFRILKILSYTNDRFGTLIITGFLTMFLFQIFENTGMTMGIMPVTGITLPFISSGGTSVVSNMIALGIILSIGVRNKQTHFMVFQ